MLLPRFEYHVPSTLREACEILQELKGKARPLAGGTDILVNMKKGLTAPVNLISLTRVEGLDLIDCNSSEAQTRIGACMTVSDLIQSEAAMTRFSALGEAARSLGTPLIRNRATIGGNLATARPAADLAPPLMAYGARIHLNSLEGERMVGLDTFFLGPGETVIREDEILSEVILDLPPSYSGCVYLKLGVRKTLEIGMVNVAAFLGLEKGKGSIREARIVLGAVAPFPMRASLAEEALKGERPAEALFEKVGEIAAGESRPIDDFRGSAEYRREMVKALTKKALNLALQKATTYT